MTTFDVAWGAPAPKIEWLDAPEDHDYAAAAQYLSLIDDPDRGYIQDRVQGLRAVETTSYYAKDILRASQLALLPPENAHVAKDLHKIHNKTKLSPVLLVRGWHFTDPLIIADGYHRVCAAYHCDENATIRCRIVT